MVKSGSYQVKQPNIFGRIGSGIGQGMAEQLPKEMERFRLAEGLKQLGQQKNLSPFQQFSSLASIPGITPQMIQSGSELLKQQARANALSQMQPSQGKLNTPPTFPLPPKAKANEAVAPSLTEPESFEQAQAGYIPPTQDEIYSRANDLFNANPALYNNNPQEAIVAAETEADKEAKRYEAYKEKHGNLTKIQDNVVNRLNEHANKLAVKVPANTYSEIEDKAIQATKPKNQGGEGLTEQQAMKKYGKELDAVSRDYKAVDSLGNWQIALRPASETLRSIRDLQEKFEERGDTENFADSLIANNKLSPKFAYAVAQPIRKVPELKREFSSIPDIKGKYTGINLTPKSAEQVDSQTLEVSKKLAPLLSKNEKASPLAIAYELEKRGYNPSIWLDYVTRNRKDLNLKESQGRQLDKPNNLVGTLNDWWLSSFSGLD